MNAIDPKFKREQFLALKAAADNGRLIPPKRKGFSRKTRRAIYERQRGLCADCGEAFNGWIFEIDHVKERALMGNDEMSNLEGLHPACHQNKTSRRAGVLAKVKRLETETFDTEDKAPSRLQSRGFDKTRTKGFDGVVRVKTALVIALGVGTILGGLGSAYLAGRAAAQSSPLASINSQVNASRFNGSRLRVGEPDPGRDGIWDCEDYALAKYAAIQRFGVAVSVVRAIQWRGLTHYIVLADSPSGVVVLDNESHRLRSPAEMVRAGYSSLAGWSVP